MTTHFLDTFTKYSEDSPFVRKQDCFVKDELGLSFYWRINHWDETGGTYSLEHELLRRPGISNLECAEAIATKLQKNLKEDLFKLIAKTFLEELPDHWVIKSSEMKDIFSLKAKHLRLIDEASSLGFSLETFQKRLQGRMAFQFSRSSPYLRFNVEMPGCSDKVKFLSCDPSELHDPSHRFGINPYPVDLGNGFSIVQQGDDLRVEHVDGDTLVWASKPYKTLNGVRSCAAKRIQEEPLRRIREQLQGEKIVEWLKAKRTQVVGHVNTFGYEPASWLENYIVESTGENVGITNVHIFYRPSEGIICGWIYSTPRPKSIPSLHEIAPWLPPALEWISRGDDPVPVTGQDVLDWMKKLEQPPT